MDLLCINTSHFSETTMDLLCVNTSHFSETLMTGAACAAPADQLTHLHIIQWQCLQRSQEALWFTSQCLGIAKPSCNPLALGSKTLCFPPLLQAFLQCIFIVPLCIVYSTVHCIVLYCVQHSVLYCTVLCTAQCTILCTAQCTVLYYIV